MEQFETNEEFMYSLIIDDLEGIITAEDKALLEEWRNTNEANERTYQDFLNIQLGIDKLYSKHSADPGDSWDVLNSKILQDERNPVKKIRSIAIWYKIAAAVLIILSVGYYFVMDSRYLVISTENNAAITYLVLPDGTNISLNAATTIKYKKDDFINDRKLELLKGEAFIQVTKHGTASQFSVDLGDVVAEDIGTSFNVAKKEEKVTVIVEEGKVALKHADSGLQVLLTPGKLGTYNADTKKLSATDNLNVNYKAWIDRKFIFMEVPLKDVTDQMQQVYLTPIRIKGDVLKDRKLTARLHYQSLDSALAVISASLQCKVTKEKDTYVLSDK
jgi:transmembrane sensor